MTLKYIGTIVNTRGYKGELVVQDVPDGLKKIPNGIEVNIGFSSNFTEKQILKSFKIKGNNASAYIQDIESDIASQKFKELGLFIDEELLIDPENKEYFEDVMQFEVFNVETNEVIGKIIEIWDMPANQVWLIKTDSGNLPVPVIEDVVRDVDYENKKIQIEMIKGLWELLEVKE